MSVAKPAEQQSEKLHGQIKFHWWRLSFHNEICEKKPTLEVGSLGKCPRYVSCQEKIRK